MRTSAENSRELSREVSKTPNATTESVAAKIRVLVVEDDLLVAWDAEHYLTEAGYEVVGIASSANDAEEMARSKKPDVVVMDVHLGGARDGVDAAVKIFNELSIRSIFATAHADAIRKERAAAANPFGWLPKPYSSSSLVNMIRSVLPR